VKRVVYQIDPKRRKPDGSFPDFMFKDRDERKRRIKWLYRIYIIIVNNAKRRDLPVNWSFGLFLKFCRETTYHALRGMHSTDLTIDRKDNLKGYTADNIQALTRGENVRKYKTTDIKRGMG
jgi:hypothetical protein